MVNLKTVRRQKGWSQRRLANKVGLTQPEISQLELGKISTNPVMLVAIANALGVTVDVLTGSGHTAPVDNVFAEAYQRTTRSALANTTAVTGTLADRKLKAEFMEYAFNRLFVGGA